METLPAALRLTVAGLQVAVGAVTSFTVTVAVQVAVLLCPSLTVSVMVFVPILAQVKVLGLTDC